MAEVGLAVGRCGCVAYTTESAAFSESTPTVEVTELRLRQPGESASVDVLRVAPVLDIFDEAGRRPDASDVDGLPWRPPR